MAACLLGSFVIVLFGFNGGDLGRDCNLEYSDQCEPVFRARATCYTTMMWVFLFFAWELVDSRRSFFDGILKSPRDWALGLWGNPFLFWSVTIGFFITIPTLYVPVINTVVFMHTGITWEWAVVVIAVLFFFVTAESYKWGKRVWLRRHGLAPKKGDEEDAYFSTSTDYM